MGAPGPCSPSFTTAMNKKLLLPDTSCPCPALGLTLARLSHARTGASPNDQGIHQTLLFRGGSQSSSSRTTWELVRNAESQTTSQMD